MNKILIVITLLMIWVLPAGAGEGGGTIPYAEPFNIIPFEYSGVPVWDDLVIELQPPPSYLTICNPEGECAIIDFNGDKVFYSGELEVAESAKLFFEYFGDLCRKEQKNERE